MRSRSGSDKTTPTLTGIDGAAPLSANGRLTTVSGVITCEGGRVLIQVEVTQGDARAEGHTQALCTGDTLGWSALAVARRGARFEASTAEVCARASMPDRNTVADSYRWCRAVTLIR